MKLSKNAPTCANMRQHAPTCANMRKMRAGGPRVHENEQKRRKTRRFIFGRFAAFSHEQKRAKTPKMSKARFLSFFGSSLDLDFGV